MESPCLTGAAAASIIPFDSSIWQYNRLPQRVTEYEIYVEHVRNEEIDIRSK